MKNGRERDAAVVLLGLSAFDFRDPSSYGGDFFVRHSGFPERHTVQGTPSRVFPESFIGPLYRQGQVFLQASQFFCCVRAEPIDYARLIALIADGNNHLSNVAYDARLFGTGSIVGHETTPPAKCGGSTVESLCRRHLWVVVDDTSRLRHKDDVSSHFTVLAAGAASPTTTRRNPVEADDY
jgi:hypothetical protein